MRRVSKKCLSSKEETKRIVATEWKKITPAT